MSERFESLSAHSQIHRMRRVAAAVLEQYPIDVTGFRLLVHGFNTSFRVDTTTGERFALRINLNSLSGPRKLDVELAWMAALADETDLTLPRPLATRDGRLHTAVWCEELGRDLPAVLMSWLPGLDLVEAVPEAVRALGALTATLHEHAAVWTPPHVDVVPELGDVLVGTPNRYRDSEFLSDADRVVIATAHALCEGANGRAIEADHARVLHADLHLENVKWLRGRLSVFDFDDLAIGVPAQDLAITSYYLLFEGERAIADLHDGYETVRPLPAIARADTEAMRAGRNIILLNDVIDIANADIIGMRERYLANSVVKLRAFLDTGEYRHDVPGVVPIDD